jgi:hypothetical protein
MVRQLASCHSTSMIPYPETEPLLPLWPDAAQPMGYGRTRAYSEAQDGTFPIDVLRVGNRYVCRTADVRRHLGLPINEPQTA